VFAKALSTLGQHTFTQVAAINEPITISDGAGWDIEINPEDIIVADEDGVVVIPLALVQIVVAKMTVAAEQDARCMEDLIAGRGVKETFSKHRK
jgi:regulator of RNase E activity RraA